MSQDLRWWLRVCALVFTFSLSGLAPRSAFAVPSYSGQTGAPCASCHTAAFGVSLTPFGQQFKLNGYVWGDAKASYVPVSAMVISSFTHTAAKQDGGAAEHFAENNNTALDQVSLFYTHRISEHIGVFVQGSYDGVAQRIAWDNLDIRYANTAQVAGRNLVWGISANNNPTVQDLWNTTPAWSYPYIGSALAPTPGASPIIEGSLAQQVYGLTGYTMIDNHLYLEAGLYKTLTGTLLSKLGVGRDSASPIKGVAPYWRAAWQGQQGANREAVGVFGIATRQFPGNDQSAGTNRYTDFGYDATYGHTSGAQDVLVQGTVVHELQKLNATHALGGSDNLSNQLNTTRLNAQYTWQQTYAGSVGAFAIHGSPDATLYGTASGSPNSRGYIAQLEFVPFGKAGSRLAPHLNVRTGLQFTYYTQFDGSARNYDGAGRSAHDNNTLFGFLWLAL